MGHTVDCSGADTFIRVYRRSSRGTGAGPAEARVQGPELAGTEDAFPRRHPLPPQGHQHQRTVPAHQAAQHVAHRGGLARQMAGQRDSSQGKRRVLLIIIAYWTLRLCYRIAPKIHILFSQILSIRECTPRISRDFNEEYPKLRIFSHPNVMPVIGCCNAPPNLVVISQFMPVGSLFQVGLT